MLIHAGEVESEKELQGSGCLEILSGAVTGTLGGEGDGSTWKGGPCPGHSYTNNLSAKQQDY